VSTQQSVMGVARLTPNSDCRSGQEQGRGQIGTMTRGKRYERTGQGCGAGKVGTWSGQGSGVETKTVANGQGRLWLTITSCCVKKKHARQTTAHPYIQ